jgi:hypothetical protein
MNSEEERKLRDELQSYKEQRQRQEGWLQRRFGCFGNLLSWIIVFAALSLVYTVFDAADSPWAYSFFGLRPTLVGEWTGAFTLSDGSRGLAHLNLWHPYAQPSGKGASMRWIEGESQSCMHSSAIQTYETYGRPNTGGSDVPLEFRPTAPFVTGYTLQSMRGSWNGDTLTLSGTVNHITDSSGSTIYNPNDVNQSKSITIIFRKGTLQDFIAGCGTLK